MIISRSKELSSHLLKNPLTEKYLAKMDRSKLTLVELSMTSPRGFTASQNCKFSTSGKTWPCREKPLKVVIIQMGLRKMPSIATHPETSQKLSDSYPRGKQSMVGNRLGRGIRTDSIWTVSFWGCHKANR